MTGDNQAKVILRHAEWAPGSVPQGEQRQLVCGDGAVFTVLSVATQRSWRDAQDEWHSKTEWHRAVAWNSLSKRVAAALWAITSWSKARWSAAPTSVNTGKGKKATTMDIEESLPQGSRASQ